MKLYTKKERQKNYDSDFRPGHAWTTVGGQQFYVRRALLQGDAVDYFIMKHLVVLKGRS